MPTFLTDNMVFVHVPKTGGTWVTEAARAAGVSLSRPQPLTGRTDSEQDHFDRAEARAEGRLSVAFVRHPLDWWRSYWGHRMRAGWIADSEIDAAASTDFNEFVLGVLERRPGHFSELVERFVGEPGNTVDFVGRFEHLREDARRALELSGEHFSERVLMAHPRENPNDYERFPASYRPNVAAALAKAERATIERFYTHEPIPPGLVAGAEIEERAAPSDVAAPARALARLESYAHGLEHALERSRRKELALERALAGARAAHGECAVALSELRQSRLLRYSRPARTWYYRRRGG